MPSGAVAKKASDTGQAPPDPWGLALRLLTGRDYSTSDLRRRLLERGCANEAVAAALERCLEFGYLDDRRYAMARARSLMAQGRAVGGRILLDLRQHGIAAELAEQALARARAEHDEETLLQDLLERRFPGFDYSAASDRERRRVVHFLQRRGFPLGRILDQLNRKG